MVFQDIVTELKRQDEAPENQDLDNLGQKMILITCMIVCPGAVGELAQVAEITQEHLDKSQEIMLSDTFKENFRNMCQMDIIPDINISQIKLVKSEFIDNLITDNSGQVQQLGNAGRLLGSWIDGVLEYTILKHEVVVLRLKNKRVLDRIQAVSQLWPKKKEFIEGAYKILLFSKGQRKYASGALQVFRGEGIIDDSFFNYPLAFSRVMRNWYEKRIEEEQAKNKKLQELHDNLLQIKSL